MTTTATSALDQAASFENMPELILRARREVGNAIVGHEHVVELVLLAALARGHVILEGPPGTAKTLLAQAIARVLGSKFQRLQFTPDTSPSDLIGTVTVRNGEVFLERGALFVAALWVLVRGGLAARKQSLPFGPFLAFGVILGFFFA